MVSKIKYIIISLIIFSCSNSDDEIINLATYLNDNTFEIGAVIACAASDENTNDVLTFYYPESGATDIRYYETENTLVDENEFSNYRRKYLQNDPFFNGYLGKFTQSSSTEKWIIITFKLNNEIKVSNPIRSKQTTKPTVWNDEVSINQTDIGMPNFIWNDNPFGDNAIYFQVISDSEDNLLSGTYTYDNHFQYYNTSNVILNVTTQTPPDLVIGNSYNFTLMDVSEDNWVNWVVLKTFEAQ